MWKRRQQLIAAQSRIDGVHSASPRAVGMGLMLPHKQRVCEGGKVCQSTSQRREYLSSSYPHCALLERVRPDYGNRRSHSGRGTNVKWFTPSRNYSPSDVGPLNVYRSSDTACAVFRLPLQCRHAGQGDNLSFGADGIWGLFGRPSERAREQCAGPGHQVSVRVGAASGLYRPVSAGTRASPQPERSQRSNAFHQGRIARQTSRA